MFVLVVALFVVGVLGYLIYSIPKRLLPEKDSIGDSKKWIDSPRQTKLLGAAAQETPPFPAEQWDMEQTSQWRQIEREATRWNAKQQESHRVTVEEHSRIKDRAIVKLKMSHSGIPEFVRIELPEIKEFAGFLNHLPVKTKVLRALQEGGISFDDGFVINHVSFTAQSQNLEAKVKRRIAVLLETTQLLQTQLEGFDWPSWLLAEFKRHQGQGVQLRFLYALYRYYPEASHTKQASQLAAKGKSTTCRVLAAFILEDQLWQTINQTDNTKVPANIWLAVIDNLAADLTAEQFSWLLGESFSLKRSRVDQKMLWFTDQRPDGPQQLVNIASNQPPSKLRTETWLLLLNRVEDQIPAKQLLAIHQHLFQSWQPDQRPDILQRAIDYCESLQNNSTEVLAKMVGAANVTAYPADLLLPLPHRCQSVDGDDFVALCQSLARNTNDALFQTILSTCIKRGGRAVDQVLPNLLRQVLSEEKLAETLLNKTIETIAAAGGKNCLDILERYSQNPLMQQQRASVEAAINSIKQRFTGTLSVSADLQGGLAIDKGAQGSLSMEPTDKKRSAE